MKRFMQKVVLLMCCFAFICIAACGNVESKGDGGDTTHEEEQGNSNEDDMAKEMYIKIGQTVLTAVLEDNSSVEALIDLLPISLTMRDYGGFEKVGEIGATLPQNNEGITTSFGDLILYQGNQLRYKYMVVDAVGEDCRSYTSGVKKYFRRRGSEGNYFSDKVNDFRKEFLVQEILFCFFALRSKT